MEAMVLGYPPEQASQINVTATKEEWEDIHEALISLFPGTIAADGLINHLEALGIGD